MCRRSSAGTPCAPCSSILRHLPAGVRLVLLSRVDPPLALVRLRLEGRLAELRAEHLRFTRPETAELLALGGPALTPDQVGMLHEATDGWPAGLRLAVSSLGAAADPDQFLDEFSGDDRSVADYLVDEVLQAMPADTRELLGLVSVCDPIPAELAGELSGRPDAARELNALQHDSGLITRGPLPSEYRVHVLLRSYLRAELARQRPTLILRAERPGSPLVGSPGPAGRGSPAGDERGAAPRPDRPLAPVRPSAAADRRTCHVAPRPVDPRRSRRR